ncbi:MAG: hypothetical protein KIH89_001770 [Candidatus Shapirobacteria bacterium]|nr:hypothetical protein [Candidatus Shapirobacteria bacterium]
MSKLKEFLKTKRYFLLLGLSVLVFLPALFNFFSADDWFHLRLVQINNWQEFLNFFSFEKTEQSAAFYRPISTQLFFIIFYKLFGLNSMFYFGFGLLLFGLIIWNLMKFLEELKFEEKVIRIASLIYGLSASNFARINFVSAYQELFMGLLVLLGLRFYIKRNWWFVILFVLALMSKETAIVFGGLMILVDWKLKENPFKKIKYYWPIILLSTIYLVLRMWVFKTAEGESYIWDFGLKKALNTTMWYGFWSVGIPEFMVDYVGSGLKIVPKFFMDFGIWAKIFLGEIGLLFLSIFGLIILKIKKLDKFVWGILFFGISLLPVMFLPWHKFSHALTLPLIGMAMILGEIYELNKNKIFKIIFVVAFLILNLSSIYNLNQKHYSVTRGEISRKVFEYFEKNYPEYPENKNFVFVNDTNPEAKQWGSSKQVAYALSSSDFFKVFYKNENIKVYYEDLDTNIPENSIQLSSRMFLE